jgi:hypothetical protein
MCVLGPVGEAQVSNFTPEVLKTKKIFSWVLGVFWPCGGGVFMGF